MLKEGDKAPVFKVLTDTGEDFDLAEHQDEKIVLYFYPRADTPGCTIEACQFRDTAKKFTKKGVTVLGVSPDTLYKYVSEEMIPAFKLGNRWKFKKSVLDNWMENQSFRSEAFQPRKLGKANRSAAGAG